MSILRDVIPARFRKWVYGAYAVGVVLIGGTQLGFATADVDQPVALTVVAAVWAYLGGAVGAVAAANTRPSFNVAVFGEPVSRGRLERLIGNPPSEQPNEVHGSGVTRDGE